jgi:hypothetical protein
MVDLGPKEKLIGRKSGYNDARMVNKKGFLSSQSSFAIEQITVQETK